MCEFTNWTEVTPANVRAALPKLLKEAEIAVAEIEAEKPTTFDGFVTRLNDATRVLWRTWADLHHMLGVMNNEEWRKVNEDFQNDIIAFSLRVSQSKALYEIAKSIKETGTRARILEKMVQSAELAGVALEGEKKSRFNALQVEISKLSNDFSNAVIDATTPEIADAIFLETMKHNPDRAKREEIYVKRVTRAPENTPRIAELLKLKKECAEILGFKSYAELSLATKCAPSVKAVFEMIDKLDEATVDQAAAEKLEGEPWDQAYLAERLREEKYSYSEEELKRYFDFKDVLAGLFKMSKFLFDIDVEEITGDEKPAVWHPDVRFFKVIEKGETIAHFYLDAYVRPGLKQGGAWMNELRNRRGKDVTPVCVVVMNLQEPKDGKALMPFREVETLFHEFGHALQQMLTRIDEEDAAGINLVEWDAVEVASQFMENWCLDDRTGIVVPEDLKAKVKAAKNFRAATACRRQLQFAKTDMILHGEELVADANEVKKEVFAHFGAPMIEKDLFLNAFTHIFSGGYSAGYYGYKWSEVMSADCYGAFEEAGLEDDAKMKELGEKYRETILALGGSKSALEVFELFRGRTPEITALLRQQDLLAK